MAVSRSALATPPGSRYRPPPSPSPSLPPMPAAPPRARVSSTVGPWRGGGEQGVREAPAPLPIGAVAARAPSAADGEVVVHGTAADGEYRSEEIGEAAAPAIAAVAAGPSRAADHGVVADGAVADGDNQAVAEAVERVEAAAPGETAALAGASRTADRRAVLHPPPPPPPS